jgi:hypothetical protein
MKNMGLKEDFFIDCVGAVVVLTDDRIIFQGQIIRGNEERHHEECCCPKVELDDDPDFIVLRLTCDPAVIKDDGDIKKIEPDFFEEGDIVRINVNEIIAVGPSRCCLGEKKDHI